MIEAQLSDDALVDLAPQLAQADGEYARRILGPCSAPGRRPRRGACVAPAAADPHRAGAGGAAQLPMVHVGRQGVELARNEHSEKSGPDRRRVIEARRRATERRWHDHPAGPWLPLAARSEGALSLWVLYALLIDAEVKP